MLRMTRNLSVDFMHERGLHFKENSMNLIGILLYAMIGFAILIVAAAVLILVFLFFEEFWRRLFHLDPIPSSQTKNKQKNE